MTRRGRGRVEKTEGPGAPELLLACPRQMFAMSHVAEMVLDQNILTGSFNFAHFSPSLWSTNKLDWNLTNWLFSSVLPMTFSSAEAEQLSTPYCPFDHLFSADPLHRLILFCLTIKVNLTDCLVPNNAPISEPSKKRPKNLQPKTQKKEPQKEVHSTPQCSSSVQCAHSQCEQCAQWIQFAK